MGAVYFRLLLECSCSQSEAAGASPSEVALEFRGDGIAVDLGDCFADVGFGVSPFFQVRTYSPISSSSAVISLTASSQSSD